MASTASSDSRAHRYRLPRRFPRRMTALAAIGTIAVLGLTACVGAKNNGGTGNASQNPTQNASAKNVTLRIAQNAVAGGKNSGGATWVTNYIIPGFTAMEKSKGVDVKVTYEGSGVDDEAYKTKLELGLKTNSAADVISIDAIWLGELAAANYVKPLDTTVGSSTASWDGWSQITSTVKNNMAYQGKQYGIPNGTDGRVLYFNKTLFAKAGLPSNWQPKTWADIIAAGKKLKSVSGVTPIQLDAGVPMGEASTTQGFLPMLAGTSQANIYDKSTGKWQGDTAAVKSVLGFYQQVYGGGLGDVKLQQDQTGRDRSFAEFSQNKIGILLESDYMWRSVICPNKGDCGATTMPDRNSVVGFAFVPSQNGGKNVSVSGGGGWVIAPGTKYPQQAWELMQYLNSKAATIENVKNEVRITARNDANAQLLSKDPLLSFISTKVLPITLYRPSDQHYPQVSIAIQQATADVVAGKTPAQAATTYAASLTKIVGASHVSSG